MSAGEHYFSRTSKSYSMEEYPIMRSLVDELIATHPLCILKEIGPGHHQYPEGEMTKLTSAMPNLFEKAYARFRAKLPGYTDIQIANLYVITQNFAKQTFGQYSTPAQGCIVPLSYHDGQMPAFNALFDLEREVNRKAKELEQAATTAAALELATKRIADLEESLAAMHQRQLAMASAIILTGNLEKRLQASEELNAKLMDRLATLEKLLL